MVKSDSILETARSTLFIGLALATLASAYTGMVQGVRRGSAVDVGLSLVVPGYGALFILWADR